MKIKHTLYFAISLFLLMLVPMTTFSQDKNVKDTLVFKQKYGLRLGVELYKPIRTLISDTYTGFEINADYRLTKRIYLAGEIGTEQINDVTDYLDVTAKGSYFKAGFDYNFYRNWLDMENMIYGGARVGISSFNQTLNSYTIYNTDQYYNEPYTSTQTQAFNGLSAIWAELIVGMKVEVLNNLYVGVNAQLKGRIIEDKPTNFGNLSIPGFNKVFDSGRFGIGFGYNISYLIPIYNKEKKVTVEQVSK